MAEQHELQYEADDNHIRLTKTYQAPQKLVYSMFKNPELLAQWWGPQSWPATIQSFDFTEGGTWHYYMTGPDGSRAWGLATFVTIDEPNSLSYDDAFSDEAGDINPDLPIGNIRFDFTEQAGATTVTMLGTYESAAEVDKLLTMGMVEGMKDTWGQLERLIAANQ